MNEHSFFKIRIYFTALVTIGIVSLLAWNYTHGGVPGHHILADKDLPKISNWWGGILLPLLTWFLSYRIQKRIYQSNNLEVSRQLTNTILGFGASLIFGILLSVSFRLGYNDLSGNMMLIIFPLALFIPLYQSQYLLGFVIAMTYTFGAVLPTGIGSILLLITAIIYLYIRSAILYVISGFKKAKHLKSL